MLVDSARSATARTTYPINAKTVKEQYILILFSSVINTIDNINVEQFMIHLQSQTPNKERKNSSVRPAKRNYIQLITSSVRNVAPFYV